MITILLTSLTLSAQPKNIPEPGKQVKKFEIGKNKMYHKGWIDFNKNGNVIGCEEYPDDASKVASKFPATIGVSEDVTMPLKDEERISTLTIHWEKDSDCDFEILTTNGGGQFLPVYKGSVKGARVQICDFERIRASEVRVGVIRGKGTVKKLESPSLR